MTFLYILLFIVCLSTLIMVHEAGHLITAKIFKVYCFEYAIGFGPRLFSFKKKNGETRYSIRAVPFGGFVSMYGESESIPKDFVGEIDASRSINNIKKWKKSIVMTAGIIMNFVLAMVVFFIYEIAFPSYTFRVGHIMVNEGSIAAEAGLADHDYVITPILSYGDGNYVFYDDQATLNYRSDPSKTVFFGYNYSQMTLKDQNIYSKAVAFERVDYGSITLDPSEYTEISYSDAKTGDYSSDEVNNVLIRGYIQAFRFVTVVDENNEPTAHYLELYLSKNYLDKEEDYFVAYLKDYSEDEYKKFYNYVPFNQLITVVGDLKTVNDKYELNSSGSNKLEILQYKTAYPEVTADNLLKQNAFNPESVDFKFEVLDEEHVEVVTPKSIHVKVEQDGSLQSDFGVVMQVDKASNSYGTAVKNSFSDFGRSTTLIFRGLGQLFTKDGFKNVGGIIAIGVVTTNTLQQEGFGTFLFMWAMISVNLGIVNLLPFPGLDGWQFLVTIVEGVAHKEIPPKVKNTVSAVGILILFVLMIMIVVKDLIMVVQYASENEKFP